MPKCVMTSGSGFHTLDTERVDGNAQYNRVVMSVVFFVPLMLTSLWETKLDKRASIFMKDIFDHEAEGEEDDPGVQDPSTDWENGMEISKESFEALTKVFPDTYQVSAGGYLKGSSSNGMWLTTST